MTMVLRLREGYEEIAATISAPPHSQLFDVGAALKDGNGEIRTDNHPLGMLLARMAGENGDLFDAYTVNVQGDEVLLEKQSSVNPVNVPGMEGAPVNVAAQHATGSEYNTLHKAELVELAQERGITSEGQTKAELVEALEASDKEGASDGS